MSDWSEAVRTMDEEDLRVVKREDDRHWLMEAVVLGGIWRVIDVCRRRQLEASDLNRPTDWFRSTANDALREDAFKRYTKEGRGAVLLKGQLRPLRKVVILGITCSAAQGLLGTIGRYLILRAIIRGSKSDMSKASLSWLAVLFFGVAISEGACSVMARQLLAGHMTHALIARSNALLMRKVASVNPAEETPSLDSIYASDIPRLLGFVRYLALLACGLTSLLGGVVVVAVFLGGLSACVAFGCMVVVGVGQQYFTYQSRTCEPELFATKDATAASLGRAVRAAKAVKFYSWEDQFAEIIAQKRATFNQVVIRYRFAMMLSISVGKAFPVVATVATLLFVASRKEGRLDAEDAFAALAVFQTIRVGMIMLPMANILMNTFIRIHDRIADFLNAPDDADVFSVDDDDAGVFSAVDDDGDSKNPEEKKAVLRFRDVRVLDETSEKEILNVPSFTIEQGTVTCVVGAVGSGKTTLLLAALGRAGSSKRFSGKIVASTDFLGYAPQDPVIVSGTVADNILLGRPRDAASLKKAVQLAEFERDVSGFPDGLDTVLGERGATLSGGQQARLMVTRAVYGEPDLLMLDASLAAVDPKVARSLFDNLKAYVRHGGCSAKNKKPRTVVLVLSQLNFVPECDACVVVDAGRIIAAETQSTAIRAKLQSFRQGSFAKHLADALSAELITDDDRDDDEESSKQTKQEPVEDSSLLERRSQLISEKTQFISEKSARGENKPDAVVQKERLKTGAISRKVFWAWCRGVGYKRLACIAFLYWLAALLLFASDLILARWTEATSDLKKYMAAYASVALSHLPTLVSAAIWGVLAAAKGSSRMHGLAVGAVLGAPVRYFESTPSGRILSRFGADFDVLDLEWSTMLDGFMTMATLFSTLVVAMSLVVPVLIPVNLACCYGLAQVLSAINTANRDLKRIANAAVAPCVTNAKEAEACRVVAASMRCSEFFVDRMRSNVDSMLAAFYASSSVMQAAYLNATVWSAFMSLATALAVVLAPGVALSDRDSAPVALSYALVAPYFASMASEILMSLSLQATSLERVFELLPAPLGGGVVPSEAPRSLPTDDQVLAKVQSTTPTTTTKAQWPRLGKVEFDQVQLRYRPGLPLALKSTTFVAEPGEKVGLVGRTGAGKSSVLVALFRLVELSGGSVRIDGLDVSTVGLSVLRKRLALIPQEPVLMQGTAKTNCDPFDEYSDDQVALALETVGLPASCLHQNLVGADADSSSLSTGENQLLALARVVLRKSTVCCFDEATAHVDANTDRLVQDTVDKVFRDSTLLCIAHRLHTVIGYDKLLVMADGQVVQSGTPSELLRQSDGPFVAVASALGPASFRELVDMAAQADRRRASSQAPNPTDDDLVDISVA